MKLLSVSAACRELRRPLWAASFFCLSISSGVIAAEATLTLDQVRLVARGDAPSVTAQRLRVVAAKEEAARAGALPDPTLKLGIDNLTATGNQAFDVGADLMTMRRIGVQQAWPSRRKRDAQRNVANAEVITRQNQTEATRLDAERRAGMAWIDAWAAEAERRLLQDRVAESDRANAIAKAQLANGTLGAAEALSAEMVRVEIDNELRRVQAASDAAKASLARWLDQPVEIPLAALPDVTRLRLPAEQLRASIDALAVLQVWDGRQRAASAAVRLAEAEKHPDLGFGLAYGARSGRSDMMMFEVSIDLPVFTRNRQDRGIAARVAERDAIEAEHEDARRAQVEALDRAIADWSSLRDELSRYDQTLLPLALDRREVALASYANAGPLRPWIEARRDEIELQRRALRIEAELARSWLLLDTLLPRDVATEVSS